MSLTSLTLLKSEKPLGKKNQILKSYFEVPFVTIVFFNFTKNGYEGNQGLSFFRMKNRKKTTLKISGI